MKILIIQTAFIGDVVLATPLIEKIYKAFPNASIDFLLSKGNESLLKNNPKINKIIIFEKKENKFFNLLKLIKNVRKTQYKYLINVQRFLSTGLITAFSGAEKTIGFDKNPLSFLFTQSIKHRIDLKNKTHEVERNIALLKFLKDDTFIKPKLYLTKKEINQTPKKDSYVCIAPSSVWFTKQLPVSKWKELILKIPKQYNIYLIGGPADIALCNKIKKGKESARIKTVAGKLNFLESAAYIKNAKITISNDSAPMHFASAVNAPVVAVYCSTIPAFGFGPLSNQFYIAEVEKPLSCRPCGLHGKKTCPKGHFKCSEIDFSKTLSQINL